MAGPGPSGALLMPPALGKQEGSGKDAGLDGVGGSGGAAGGKEMVGKKPWGCR